MKNRSRIELENEPQHLEQTVMVKQNAVASVAEELRRSIDRLVKVKAKIGRRGQRHEAKTQIESVLEVALEDVEDLRGNANPIAEKQGEQNASK